MFSAYKNLYTKEKISIDNAYKGRNYYCPSCRKRLFVVVPEYKRPYFCHYRNESCIDYWKYDESEWSDAWKSKFDINNIETSIVKGNVVHHIDINVKNKLAIMFQKGTIHAETLREKTDFITSLGYKLLWLFNLEQIYNSGRIAKTDDPNVLNWKVPSRMFEDYTNANNVYIVAEILSDKDNSETKGFAVLTRMNEIVENRQIYVKRWLTRNQFIKYFNDIADGIDPEIEYRQIDEKERKEREISQEKERLRIEEARKQRLLEAADKERKRREKQLAYQAEQKAKLEAEIAKRTKEAAIYQAEQEKRKQEELRIKEQELELLKNKHTIAELWNVYSPKQYLIVANKSGSQYQINRDPSEQQKRHGRIFGILIKEEKKRKREEAVKNAEKHIWRKVRVK